MDYRFFASLHCAAFSPSATALIASQGFFSCGRGNEYASNTINSAPSFSDPQERAIAIGIWSAVASGGAALGPLIGGILLNNFWWGSVF